MCEGYCPLPGILVGYLRGSGVQARAVRAEGGLVRREGEWCAVRLVVGPPGDPHGVEG